MAPRPSRSECLLSLSLISKLIANGYPKTYIILKRCGDLSRVSLSVIQRVRGTSKRILSVTVIKIELIMNQQSLTLSRALLKDPLPHVSGGASLVWSLTLALLYGGGCAESQAPKEDNVINGELPAGAEGTYQPPGGDRASSGGGDIVVTGEPMAGEVMAGVVMAGEVVTGGVTMGGATPPGGDEPAGAPPAGGAPAGDSPAGDEPAGAVMLPPDPNINAGWIGGPCQQDADCAYEGGICLPEEGGYPRGMCTQDCDRFCPDQDGMPVTFCIGGVLMTSGGCVQRCDYLAFQGTGCRPGYSCVTRSRYQESSTSNGVCLPTEQVGEPDPVMPPPGSSECIRQLAALGLNFEYNGDQRESPGGNASLTCEVDDAVRVQNPINGVVYRYIESSSASALYGSCELMLAVYELSALLREYDIVEVGHIGTYNCRVISGTSTLSRHGYGDAIDLGSFFDSSGEEYNLVRDWQHNTTNFTNDKARILYEIGLQMHERDIFNIVLTPNYNAAHDNHFHVDLTPGSDYHGKMDEGAHACGNEH